MTSQRQLGIAELSKNLGCSFEEHIAKALQDQFHAITKKTILSLAFNSTGSE
jgi:hypothetical protein